MAKLKKKPDAEMPEETVVEETLTEDEKEVLEQDGEEYQDEQSKVSSEKMSKVLDILQEKFNLKDKNFELTGYADKGNKIVATLTNSEYEATFTLKSQETIMMLNMQ